MTHPVDVLVAARSQHAFTTRADAERMHALLGSSSELAWLAGVGHMPNLEAPDAFNAALARLLRRVASAANQRLDELPRSRPKHAM